MMSFPRRVMGSIDFVPYAAARIIDEDHGLSRDDVLRLLEARPESRKIVAEWTRRFSNGRTSEKASSFR